MGMTGPNLFFHTLLACLGTNSDIWWIPKMKHIVVGSKIPNQGYFIVDAAISEGGVAVPLEAYLEYYSQKLKLDLSKKDLLPQEPIFKPLLSQYS